MQFAGRSVGRLAGSLLQRRHYTAARNMLRVYERPAHAFRSYVTGSGTYPGTVGVRTPQGRLDLNLYTWHDLLTVNEIFCRGDYLADSTDKVVVDFGSNIGISAAYFLSRGPDTFTYLFEPLPRNVERLHKNLSRFQGRYELQEVAVGIEEGEVSFGYEDTGRYGGIGAAFTDTLTVPCVDSRQVLSDVLDKHGAIDILKIDIEGFEVAVIDHISDDVAPKIRKLYVEEVFDGNPLERTHTMHQSGIVAQFNLKPG